MFLKARYFASAAKAAEIPSDAGPELAFAGRSNVGKSSAINALCGRKSLAFASKAPGRTRTINFFDLGAEGRLADLPGYGYASAPKVLRSSWDALIGDYLISRQRLAGVVVLMDARHPLTANDRNFLEWLRPVCAPRLILLSKSDKLPRDEQAATLTKVRSALGSAAEPANVLLFSSRTGDGVEAARARLELWLEDAARSRK